jgi:hypothetical protein
MHEKHFKWLLLCLRVATVAVFLGRAWQLLYWDAPLRTLLWDEGWMAPVVGFLGWEWEQWVRSETVDGSIQWTVKVTGFIFLSCAAAAIWVNHRRTWLKSLLVAGAVLLTGLAFLYMKEKFFHLGQFFEYALQFSTPLFLVAWLKPRPDPGRFFLTVRVAIALTFVCHGLYAIGYYPRPGNFTEMVMAGFGVEESTAIVLLRWAGWLDFVCGALLLTGLPGLLEAGLVYAVIWGFLTAMARVYAYLVLTSFDVVLWQWLHESLYRWCHFLVPLGMLGYLYLLKRERKRTPKTMVPSNS